MSWTYEQVKYINVHLASTNHEHVKYRNVHLVSRTTEQVKYINVHLVSRSHDQVKYKNVHLVSRSHEQVKYRNAHLVLRTTEQIKYRDVLNLYWNIWYLSKLWKDSRDRMVVRFTTTGAINAYHYYSCEFEFFSWRVYSIQHYVIVRRQFFPATPVSSTNKTDINDISEILLTVGLNSITHNPYHN